MRRLETVRTQEEGWQEPCESGGSRTDLWERGGEIPLRYPTQNLMLNDDNGKSEIALIMGSIELLS